MADVIQFPPKKRRRVRLSGGDRLVDALRGINAATASRVRVFPDENEATAPPPPQSGPTLRLVEPDGVASIETGWHIAAGETGRMV